LEELKKRIVDLEGRLNYIRGLDKSKTKPIAIEQGFTTVKNYLNYLMKTKELLVELSYQIPTSTKPPVVKSNITNHIIDVLDCSGSMGSVKNINSKLFKAKEGILNNINSLKADARDHGYNYTYSLYVIGSKNHCSFIIKNKAIEEVDLAVINKIRSLGLTFLYSSVLEVINYTKLLAYDNTQLAVYTDGEDTYGTSHPNLIHRLKEAYNSKPDNLLITFAGTKSDMALIQNKLGIEDGNLSIYDGTSSGLKQSFKDTAEARSKYSKSISKGVTPKNLY
jgi:hypothetical protein